MVHEKLHGNGPGTTLEDWKITVIVLTIHSRLYVSFSDPQCDSVSSSLYL